MQFGAHDSTVFLQAKPELTKARQFAENGATPQPLSADRQEPVDTHGLIREGAGQDCSLPGGKQQVCVEKAKNAPDLHVASKFQSCGLLQ